MHKLARNLRALSLALTAASLPGLVAGQVEAGRGPAEVAFTTADGGEIHGHLYGDGGHAVVLAHGMVFDKESWRPLAERLAAEGLTVLAIDFRGYGKSMPGTEEKSLELDVLGAIRYLSQRGSQRVSVLGASMGGGAAARAAVLADPGEIDRLVLLAPAGIADPERMHAGHFTYIVAAGDPSLSRTRNQYERAPEPKQLEILPGDAHAQHIFRTEQAEELTAAIRTALLEP